MTQEQVMTMEILEDEEEDSPSISKTLERHSRGIKYPW
jgi:hypothetical protein